ncbi:PAS domain S-box-containing protein [Methanohalophilus levihalophilus]|uniref:histidine kinase dimerization/phosphoacceptor domain -containing protein n=1 Tax=Methanohalophilus levihalophilus TaxID=1431282 RepID=UPI001AE5D00B|nr:histidine kinase dimerization/phosphoacceptor domain -containing protein [Methanohalophilus levihalophilus]MBP2029794.1 PAS domain S-box-containing protein [Methanohalophilus levihalophilus]
MNWKDLPLRVKFVLYIVAGVFLILSISSSIVISTVTTNEEQLAYDEASELAKRYANGFNADMKSNMAIARSIASSMAADTSPDRDEVNRMLEQQLKDNPHLVGAYVGFEPNAFDGKDSEYANTYGHDSTGRFVPYWYRRGDNIYLEPLVYYDEQEYYQGPETLKRDVITEPYFYEGVLMVSYDSPIIKDGAFVGIGGVDVLLDYVDEIVSSVTVFETGYLFMVSNDGVIVSHPVRKDWIGYKNLHEFDRSELVAITSDISEGKGGFVETIDPVSGENIIVFYEPIETGNYSVLLAVPTDEMFAGVNALRANLLTIYSFSIVFMGLMAYIIVTSFTDRINDIVRDFKNISSSAIKGDLDRRANTDVETDFKQIPVGLNEILDALTQYSREVKNSYEIIRKMESAVTNSPVVAFWWKAEPGYPVEYVSSNIERYGYSVDDFLSGKLIYGDIVHPDDLNLIYDELNQRTEEGWTESHQEYRLITKTGEVRWVHEDTHIERDNAGNVIRYQGTVRDVTESKLAEDALIAMEEIRTKEVHHRIKNNLQVVSGLLYLESLNFKYAEVIEAFKESENRIRSIALIHEKLYRSADLVSLDFSEYVTDLIDFLFHSYDVDEDLVKMNLKVEDVYLDMDRAVPLGIIINELTSNALKHAFKDGEEGVIDMSFFRNNNDFILSIHDSGTSFPADLDINNTESLGLQLVTRLVAQIDGSIELDTTEGTTFTITFSDGKV